MGSFVPFQDLNLLPHPPKIKPEPIEFDPFPQTPFHDQKPKLNHSDPSDSHSNSSKDYSQSDPFSQALIQDQKPILNPSYPSDSLSNSSKNYSKFDPFLQTLNQDQKPILNPSDPSDPSESDPLSNSSNVYSQFCRISDMFSSTFEHKMEKSIDFGAPVGSESDINVSEPPETTVSTTRRNQKRSNELVRVANLGVEDQRYFRDIVRRTRILYDSLRIRLGKRGRGDLKAAAKLRERGLWLNRDKRIVGSIPGVYVGDLFFFRIELCVVGLHGQTQAGIDFLPSSQSSTGEPIATSITVFGGCEDDEDEGDVLIYTGLGGHDKFHRVCTHQTLDGCNLALERSMRYNIEIRVIRGLRCEGSAATLVYVYDGLYRIVNCWFDMGRSGFGVFKYKLVRLKGQPQMGSTVMEFARNVRNSTTRMRQMGYICVNITKRRENLPVFLFNDIDSDTEPMDYEYLPRTIFPPFVYASTKMGCSCVSQCTDDCFCGLKNGGEIAYDHHGFLLRGKPVIFECGPNCTCPCSCRNRVTQRGLRHRLEVFRTTKTGWGVRCLDLLHAGEFICEYTGVVLTNEQAKVCSMGGDSLIYPNRFAERWTEWGDLSQVYPDYKRPNFPSLPPLDFALDVSRMRNVASYISRSSSPNLMVQFVLYDHNNMMFPHVTLFAAENIPPMRELTLDYGVADEYTGKPSICK